MAGLLIGADAAVVSEPLEAINSPSQGGPYAVRSRYGWMVCGIGNDRLGQGTLRVNRMKIRTHEEPKLRRLETSGAARTVVEDRRWRTRSGA